MNVNGERPKPKPRKPRQTSQSSTESLESLSCSPKGSSTKPRQGSASSESSSQLYSRNQSIAEENDDDIYGNGEPPIFMQTPSNPQLKTNLLSEIAALQKQVDSLTSTVGQLYEEEKGVRERCEKKRREEVELTEQVDRLREEEKKMESRLGGQVKEGESKLLEDHMQKKQLELERREADISDRESAIKQENLKLQRLADQLHMQKKDLIQREFDLDTYGGSQGQGGRSQERAELAEREKVVQLKEAEINDRELDLQRRQESFEQWRKGQQQMIQQGRAEIGNGALLGTQLQPSPYPLPPSSSSSPPHILPTSHITAHQNIPPHNVPLAQPAPLPPTHFAMPNFTSPQPPQMPPAQMYTALQYKPSHPHTQAQAQALPAQYCPPPGVIMGGNFQWGGGVMAGQAVGGGGIGGQSSRETKSPSLSRNRSFTVPGANSPALPPKPKNIPISHRADVIGLQANASDLSSSPDVITGGEYNVSDGTALGFLKPSVAQPRPPRPKSQISMDEELAHHLSEYSPPSQTTQDIQNDEAYARQLQQQLAMTDEERDREIALALQQQEFPSLPEESLQGEATTTSSVQADSTGQSGQNQQAKNHGTAKAPQGISDLNDLG